LADKIILHQGNCLEEMDRIEDGSIDLIAVDPPYGATQNRWDVVIPFEPMWEQIKRVLKVDGVAVFTTSQPYTSQLIMSNPDWYRYDIVWEKSIGSGQLNIRWQPLRVHESLLIFYYRRGTYNEQKTEGLPYKIIRKASEFVGSYGKQRDHKKINDGYRHARSIIKVPNPRIKGGHKAEKPLKLMEYIVKTYSNEGDTVLDFAMGRGTTGLACLNLNRRFVGIELELYWFEEAFQRLEIHLNP